MGGRRIKGEDMVVVEVVGTMEAGVEATGAGDITGKGVAGGITGEASVMDFILATFD